MPKNNQDFNMDFLTQFLQNDDNTSEKLALISSVLTSLGEGLFTMAAILTFEGKQSENFDGTDATNLALIGGSIQTFGDIVATIAAVRAIEELQNKKRNKDSTDTTDKIKELERENKYLKAQLNKLKKREE